MADQLCTINQVKSRLFPAGGTDTADDTMLTEMVEQVSAWVQGYTGRKLVPESSTTYTFDTQPGYVLYVPRGIRTISFMGVNNLVHQPDAVGSYVTVISTDYLLRPKVQDMPEGWPFTEVHISRGTLSGTITSFGRIDNGCVLTGTFGFAATPPDIQAVTIDAVVAAYNVRKMGASGVIGADDIAAVPWSQFFGRGSPQRNTLDRYMYRSLS